MAQRNTEFPVKVSFSGFAGANHYKFAQSGIRELEFKAPDETEQMMNSGDVP
jgi:hypothetical protein